MCAAVAAFLVAALLASCSFAADEPPKESEADLQFEFAGKLFQIQVYKAAIPEYAKFLKDYPTDPRREEARFQLAMCHFKLGGPKDLEHALAELSTLRKEFPNGKRAQDCLFRSGHIRYMLGDAKGALADLLELSKLPVQEDLRLPMHHFLGRAYYDLGQDADAVKNLSVVAAGPKENPLRRFALIILADAHARMKAIEPSLAALDTLLKDYPDLVAKEEMLLKQADARLALRQFVPALETYQKIDPNGAFKDRAALGQAQALLGLKKYAEAGRTAAALLAAFKETPETKHLEIPGNCLYVIGLAHFNAGEYAQSADAFSKLMARVQQGAMAEDAAYKLCWCYYHLRPSDEKADEKMLASCVAFRRLFPTSQWTPQVVFLTAEGYLNRGDFDNAIANYKQVGEKDANYPEALYRIGYCYHMSKRPAEAAATYDQFVAKFGGHAKAPAALASAGGLYQAAGKFPEAIERYSQYLAKAPDGPEAEDVIFQRGICFAKQARFDDMAAVFEAYAQKYPKGRHAAAALYWRGRHRRILGDALAEKNDLPGAVREYSTAIESLRAALALNPPDKTEVQLALAESQYNLGKSQADQAADAAARAKGALGAEKETLDKLAKSLHAASAEALKDAASGFLAIITASPAAIKTEAVYLWTGGYLREHKDPKSALLVFKAMLDNFKESAHGDFALYQIALLHGELAPPDFKAVVAVCDDLLARYAQSPLVLQTKFRKADALLALRQFAEAERLYAEVAQKGGGALKVGATLKLGHVCLARKEYAAAARYFAEIGLLYVNDQTYGPEALFYAGQANALLKDDDQAAKFWQQLLARYPESNWAAQARKELQPLGYEVGPDGTIRKR